MVNRLTTLRSDIINLNRDHLDQIDWHENFPTLGDTLPFTGNSCALSTRNGDPAEISSFLVLERFKQISNRNGRSTPVAAWDGNFDRGDQLIVTDNNVGSSSRSIGINFDFLASAVGVNIQPNHPEVPGTSDFMGHILIKSDTNHITHFAARGKSTVTPGEALFIGIICSSNIISRVEFWCTLMNDSPVDFAINQVELCFGP
jgi:hypothetical protein